MYVKTIFTSKKKVNMKVVTLTINPVLDPCATVSDMKPFDKLECHDITSHSGGNGINISRVVHRFAIEIHCLFPYGGKTGEHLIEFLEKLYVIVFAAPISI